MARQKRVVGDGLVYHVINRGNNRQAIFLDEDDFRLYLGLLYRYKVKYDFKLFAYCLMTNHVHLLIQTTAKATVSQIMQSLTNAHTRHYHYKYKTSGHVWQGRFKSPIVSDDQYMLKVMQYIEENPVRAGMVNNVCDYKWSSYKLNVQSKLPKLIDRSQNPVFCKLATTQEECIRHYRKLMAIDISPKSLDEIRKSVKSGDVYISKKFQERLEQMIPRKKRRGRPRKQLLLN